MEFRLTYEGILLGSSRSDTRSGHKHEVRKFFHPQIKKLWEVTPHLNEISDPVQHYVIDAGGAGTGLHDAGRIASLARRFSRGDYGFVPLVTKDLFVACGIDILFLRPDPPGEIIRSGDIDNRLKTLFDALKLPADLVRWEGIRLLTKEKPHFSAFSKMTASSVGYQLKPICFCNPFAAIPILMMHD